MTECIPRTRSITSRILIETARQSFVAVLAASHRVSKIRRAFSAKFGKHRALSFGSGIGVATGADGVPKRRSAPSIGKSRPGSVDAARGCFASDISFCAF